MLAFLRYHIPVLLFYDQHGVVVLQGLDGTLDDIQFVTLDINLDEVYVCQLEVIQWEHRCLPFLTPCDMGGTCVVRSDVHGDMTIRLTQSTAMDGMHLGCVMREDVSELVTGFKADDLVELLCQPTRPESDMRSDIHGCPELLAVFNHSLLMYRLILRLFDGIEISCDVAFLIRQPPTLYFFHVSPLARIASTVR